MSDRELDPNEIEDLSSKKDNPKVQSKTKWEARFWSKVDKKGEDECWPWLTGCDADGYGQFWRNNVNERANRVVWELIHGEIPKDQWGFTLYVLHTCDNPKCCNPKHLWIGTPGDNTKDTSRKGRARGGPNTWERVFREE